MIAGGVVLFHVAALWALQTGLLRRAVEVIVPAQILAEMITPPAPKVEVPPAPAPTPPVPKPKVKAPPPPPMPVAIADPTPAPNAPTGVVAPQPAPAPIAAPVAAAPSPPAPPAPPKIELPSSEASYLQNPTPVYPAMSKRLQEQGKVIVRVMIGVDGQPQNASVRRSSGFERLDRAAVEYVMKCRYVPGKVAGVAQAMWYDAPVNFELTF
jgi:protein TonB